MKVLFFLLIISSCGKIDIASTGLGQERSSAEFAISTDDLVVFDRVCEALTRKVVLYSASLPSPMTYTVERTDCEGVSAAPVDQSVAVENAGGNFQLRVQATNAAFVFPNSESQVSGVMAPFCAGVAKLPLKKTNGDATWISRSVSSGDCPPSAKEDCFAIETGSPSGKDEFKIHTREFIRFNVNKTSPRYGLFTFRKVSSANGCLGKQFSSTSATLK